MTERELLERLRALGHDIPPSRFARWREKGLVPVTGPRSGRGQGRGRVAYEYPEIAVEQALRIIEMRNEHLDLDEIGWRLWIEGYEVKGSLWFDVFKSMADQFDQCVVAIRKDRESDDPGDLIDRLLEVTLKPKTSNRLLRKIRKELGPKRFATIMNDVASMAAGTYRAISSEYFQPTENREAQRTLDIATGFSQARSDTVNATGPIMRGDYSLILRATFEPFGNVKLATFLKDVDPADLQKVARSMRGLLGSISIANSIFEQTYAKNAFGLSRAAMLVKLDRHIFAAITLIWFLVQTKSRENFHDLDKIAQLFLAGAIGAKRLLEESQLGTDQSKPIFRRQKLPKKNK